MKKLTVVVLAMCLALPVFVSAQENPVDKGAMMIGGSAGFNISGGKLNEDPDGKKSTSFWISPGALYFVMPGLGVGADFNFSKWSQGEHSSTNFGIGPTVAYFLGTGNLLPFISASYLYSSNTYKASPETKTTYTVIALRLGVMKMLNSKVGLFARASYNLESEKYEKMDAVKGNKMGIDFGLNIFK